MYLFSIPDSTTSCSIVNTRNLNLALFEAIEQHKEWFFDDFVIETAYGCPGACIWNGNRYCGELDEFDKGWIDAVLGWYKEHGVMYRLVFTNFLLKKEHLKDPMCNELAKAVSREGGYVTLSTNLMAEHIKRYPGLKICWSTTTDFGKTEEDQIKKINRLSKDNLVVLPYEFNNRVELDKFEHPQNLEILINERCVENCPNRRNHWTELNQVILTRGEKLDMVFAGLCAFKPIYENGKLRKHNVTRAMLSWYADKGINHFKISGRVEPTMVAKAYKEYFVRREYMLQYDEFIDKFLIEFFARSN